ncbi:MULTISPECIES: sulfatase-like hydrolase/transferase [unclassified Ruegeria]|uniref:sulfatase-like hydrolase/transferase n=1 Tax=unclassified Ruegeria TaxID=2625375 RepID=UPI0014890959|nr:MULTISPECIES: sulfatase-like hydrolase/transferase [unclassified Ruegeria]
MDTIYSAKNEFRPVELDYIRTAFVACSVVLVALVIVTNFLPPKLAIAARAVTGFFFAAAVVSINWSMVEAFVLLPTIAMIGICLLAIYLTYIVLSLGIRGRAIVAILVAVAFIIVPLRDVLDAYEEVEYTEFPAIDDIKFDNKPNVYLISLDSIHPKSLTSRYMGIEETAFHEPIYSRMDRFENLFSARVPTKNAMNLMLRMELDEFDRGKSSGKSLELYRGKYDGRLNAIFRNNGYEINTAYSGNYFGTEQGSFVDRYHIPLQTAGACEFNDSKFRQVSLFGLCRFIDKNETDIKIDKAAHVLDFVSYLSRQKKPQFLLASIYSPGHTRKDFLIEDEEANAAYNDYYLNKSLEARQTLDQLLDQLEREDPTAILYIFGDHGPWRSRGDRKTRFAKDPEFFVHDRFGILGGIFPKGRCKTYVNLRNEQPYTTSVQGAEAILKCLTEGRYQELDQDYRIRGRVDGISSKFEDYIYE